ncbi:MAG: cell envelope integrity protein TolA [Cellvibrionales bacterium]|nr:cell envelope integrity protein TolA [Cellvibrionales bacterium]
MRNPDLRAKSFTFLSILASLAIHAGLIWVLSLQAPEQKPRVAKRPEIIKATVVDRKQLVLPEDKKRMEEQKKREERKRLERLKQERIKKEQQRKEKAAREKAAKEKKLAEQKRQEQLKKEARAKQALKKKEEKKALEEKARKAEAAKKLEAQRKQQELLEQQRIQKELELAQERQIQAGKDEKLAMSYMGLIKEVIENNWSRPPSARNGMEVLLTIHMLPNGRIVQVDIARSSGNSAFDRSAVIAVEKTEQISELSELPNHVFEEYYRRFDLLFRPEDLRL